MPRLTIGIPTHGRAERCHWAISSALWQEEPVRIIVSDDSEGDDIARMMAKYEHHPLISYHRSPAQTLWQNWRHAARLAAESDAEFFMWLQDDDLIGPWVSRRIARAFDRFPKSELYCTSLITAFNNMLGNRWMGNQGPRIPLDHLFGNPQTFPAGLLTIIGYVDAWSMSPAKAFRVGDRFREMLEVLPDHCDLLTEVMDAAYMSLEARPIADPQFAGYWMFHDANESMLRNREDKAKEEVPISWAFLDSLMDQLPGWRDILGGWINYVGTSDILESYCKTIDERPGMSPYADQIKEMFQEVLDLRKAKIEVAA